MVSYVESGMIYFLEDLNGSMSHSYLILKNVEVGPLKQVQCMTITSMTHHDVTTEIPILLSNDKISYIVPYNIHSFVQDEFVKNKFNGIVIDDILTKEEFIKLCADMFCLHTFGMDNDNVMQRYKEYCTLFWSKYSGKEKYSDVKKRNTSMAQLLDQAINAKQPMPKVKPVASKPKEELPPEVPALPLVNKSVPAVPTGPAQQKQTLPNTVSTAEDTELAEFMSLLNADKFVRNWTDKEISLFMKMYKTVTPKKIFRSKLNSRWKNQSYLDYTFKSVSANAKKKGVNAQTQSRYSKMTISELENYLAEYEKNKKNNETRLLKLFNVTNKNDLASEVYFIKKELQQRKAAIKK